jgi:hypothetical protein
MHRYFFRNGHDLLMAGVGARKMSVTIAPATVAALDCGNPQAQKGIRHEGANRVRRNAAGCFGDGRHAVSDGKPAPRPAALSAR